MAYQDRRTRIDLHNHVAIGLQDCWLKLQGYKGKNILRLFADKCFSEGIGFCAVTSESFEIPKGTAHDRLNWLINKYAPYLPNDYQAGRIGNNVFGISHENKALYLLNGQSVIVNEQGTRINHLVVGTNKIPNRMSLEQTLTFNPAGLINIGEQVGASNHFGMGFELLTKHSGYIDAVEGNAQFILAQAFSFVPLIGHYNQRVNKQAKEFASKRSLPYIFNSNAHNIAGTGSGYIETPVAIRTDTEEHVISDIKELIKTKNFTIPGSLEKFSFKKFLTWLNWTARFYSGLALKIDK